MNRLYSSYSHSIISRLFVCQDEDENEPEDEFFRSFRIKTVTNEPGPQYYDTLKDRSSCTSSRTNQSFGVCLRFRLRLGT